MEPVFLMISAESWPSAVRCLWAPAGSRATEWWERVAVILLVAFALMRAKGIILLRIEMSWLSCKKKATAPVIDVLSPRMWSLLKETVAYVGLDRRENTLYFCLVKVTDVNKIPNDRALTEKDLNWMCSYYRINSIKKKRSGGLVITWHDYSQISEYEPLETGEVYVNSSNNRYIFTPEKKTFERTGHPEFDLLECLFKA